VAQAILQKSTVPLRGGLDLISPRFAVDPGSLQDCLNYETYGVAGYSVVEGLGRYDGAFPCYNRDWVVAVRASGSGNFTIGQYLKVGDNYFGVTLAWDASEGVLEYLIINPLFAPKVGDTITVNGGGATLIAGLGGIKRASLYYEDMADFLEAQKAIYEAARTNKKSIYLNANDYSRNVIPHGLHWYRGSLYAIADSYQIAFDTGTVEVLPGDQFSLTGAKTATVLSVTVTSGAWSDGDAAGTMTLRTDGFTTTNSVSLGSTTVRRPNGASAFTTYAAAINITDRLVPNSPTALLFQGPLDEDYQTTEQINANANRPGKLWKPVDMGWQISFATDDDTTGDAPTTVFRGQELSDVLTNTQDITAYPTNQVLDAAGTLTNPMGAKTTTSPAATALSTVLGDSNTATYVQIQELLVQGTYNSLSATLNGFDLSAIPDGAIITGIELTVNSQTGANDTLITNWSVVGDVLTSIGATAQTKSVSQSNVTSATDTVLGGSSDLWGMLGLTTANLIEAIRDDATFGFKFDMTLTNDVSGSGAGRVSGVALKVYYQTPVTAYYAHDPVTLQDLEITIPYYRLTKGQFNPGVSQTLWGEGSMAIYNITPLDAQGTSPASSTWTIGTGWELRTAREGGGTLIAKFTSQMEAATLPPRAKLERVRKRFEIITANYYANADWVAMYGVSGVGPSWQYDGYYFYNVYTELPLSEDTPSHICYHRNYAVLGYDNGQCIVSFPGEPTNFSSVDGATLYPFGNRITGLLSLNGTALGVFCESAIHALAGDILAAVDNNNAVSQVISPYSGAIEYTVVDCGIPLFADHRGISTIDATNKYGDFENGRISYQVTPYLSDRCNDRFAFQATRQNILFATPIRGKNQYRLYFEDGEILTCGLPTGDRGYEFTKQRYSDSSNLDTLVPVAMCTATSKGGRDLIFATFRILPDDDTNIVTPSEPDREMYVYEVDKGTRFDLAPIKHFARLNYMTIDAPNDFDVVRKIRMEILSYHYFNEYVSLTADYQEPSKVRNPVVIDPEGQTVRVQKDSDYLIVSTEGIGTTLAIEIGGEHIYPGHVLQAMLVYSTAGRDNLGSAPNQKLV
jgi:hypothetical protein